MHKGLEIGRFSNFQFPNENRQNNSLCINPQEAKRVAVAALLRGQVPISTIARQEKVCRA